MTQRQANLDAVRAALEGCRRIANHQCTLSNNRLDEFEMYATRGGLVVIYTYLNAKRELEHFEVFGPLGRDNKMETTLQDIRAMIEGAAAPTAK